MTIQERIKRVAKKMGIAYIYHNWTSANVMLESVKLPVMVNVLPVSGFFHLDGYQLKESANCLVAFLDKTDFDFDAEENDTIVEKMKQKAKRFLRELNDDGGFEEIDLTNVRYEVVYDKMDINLTGIILDLSLRKTEGDCMA